jgi:flavin-dependent dehydrogenase
VLAHGRRQASAKGKRLFGFKTHFEGSADDSVQLFFFSRCYVGVSPVEGGLTNVCGLVPEAALSARGFEIDAMLESEPALKERLKTLRRNMKWMLTAPVTPDRRLARPTGEAVFPAGDALGFVDPFTGSGILSALLTGRAAGQAAARGRSVAEYLGDCSRILSRQYCLASFLSGAISSGLARYGLGWIPGGLLFRATRPRMPSG